MKTIDGGPAFPTLNRLTDRDPGGREYSAESSSGLSLRDYFAGKALGLAHKFLEDGYCGNMEMNAESLAAVAYEIANAMLKARSESTQ